MRRPSGYAVRMELLPLPFSPALSAYCAPAPAGEPVSELIAELARRGPLSVLDGGNCFPAYRVLRAVRARTADPTAVMRCITVRRAFTCFQMLAMLAAAPGLPEPCLLLDLLATFYDEQVSAPEARRLLEGCLKQVERLARAAPLLITLTPPRTAVRVFLTEQVLARVQAVFDPDLPPPAPAQLALFPAPPGG